MKLLYLSYWGIEEGLTKATVIPHLRMLSDIDEIEKILFVSIERDSFEVVDYLPSKVDFIPFQSKKLRLNHLTKINDVRAIVTFLKKKVEKEGINFMLGRSSLAGSILYKLHRKFGVKYAVESFEPHADYMYESGVWKWYDPRFLFQRNWEARQKKTATYLMPVSNHYRRKLIDDGIDQSRIELMPCAVNLERFKYSQGKRKALRKQLRIDEKTTVGIYVGKFGGIYYDLESAFSLFKIAFDFFEDFRLILLTPDNKMQIEKKATGFSVSLDKISILKVEHHEVPGYLSAADFAFSLHLPGKTKKYLSPIKNGEYWASGLPIVISEGIGDDSEIVAESGAGAILEFGKFSYTLKKIDHILRSKKLADLRNDIAQLALKHRSFEISRKIYGKIFRSANF